MAWWALKTRYPPYIDGVVGFKNPLPTISHLASQIEGSRKSCAQLYFTLKFSEAKL